MGIHKHIITMYIPRNWNALCCTGLKWQRPQWIDSWIFMIPRIGKLIYGAYTMGRAEALNHTQRLKSWHLKGTTNPGSGKAAEQQTTLASHMRCMRRWHSPVENLQEKARSSYSPPWWAKPQEHIPARRSHRLCWRPRPSSSPRTSMWTKKGTPMRCSPARPSRVPNGTRDPTKDWLALVPSDLRWGAINGTQICSQTHTHIYICVCMHVWLYDCMNVRLYECMNVNDCMNAWMQMTV